MQPILKFTVRNQMIKRIDNFIPVRNSKNYLYAEFVFLTEDWVGKSKTVLFHSVDGEPVQILLGETDTCLIPAEVLAGTSFTISVIAGDMITANAVTVKLYESGYRQGDIPEPSQSLYEQIMHYFDETKKVATEGAVESESWAHGHSDYPDRDKDNAKYYYSQAQNAVKGISGRVEEGKKSIDKYVGEKEAELKGETGNVYFAAFKVVQGRLIMYSDPLVDKVCFYREGSRLKYRLAL